MSEHSVSVDHAPHWETSPWPLVLAVGILFLVPFSFVFNFAYHQPLFALLCLGIGAPLTVAGVSGWVHEAVGGHGEGLAFPAMGWFILAEAMIFLSMFASYWFMRLTAPSWPPAGTVELPTVVPLVMTATLVASSLTMHRGEALLARGERGGFIGWLLVTIALGAAFLAMSGFEWRHLIQEGFIPATNAFGTVFFSITGFHGGHVIVGLGIFLAVLIPALAGRINDGFVKTAALYWHFVDIIWFFVVSQVYYW